MPENFDRRSFIRRSSLSAAAVGAIGVTGGTILDAATPANAATTDPNGDAVKAAPVLEGQDVVVHLHDARTGELSILSGDHEIHTFNRDLAQQLMRAAR